MDPMEVTQAPPPASCGVASHAELAAMLAQVTKERDQIQFVRQRDNEKTKAEREKAERLAQEKMDSLKRQVDSGVKELERLHVENSKLRASDQSLKSVNKELRKGLESARATGEMTEQSVHEVNAAMQETKWHLESKTEECEKWKKQANDIKASTSRSETQRAAQAVEFENTTKELEKVRARNAELTDQNQALSSKIAKHKVNSKVLQDNNLQVDSLSSEVELVLKHNSALEAQNEKLKGQIQTLASQNLALKKQLNSTAAGGALDQATPATAVGTLSSSEGQDLAAIAQRPKLRPKTRARKKNEIGKMLRDEMPMYDADNAKSGAPEAEASSQEPQNLSKSQKKKLKYRLAGAQEDVDMADDTSAVAPGDAAMADDVPTEKSLLPGQSGAADQTQQKKKKKKNHKRGKTPKRNRQYKNLRDALPFPGVDSSSEEDSEASQEESQSTSTSDLGAHCEALEYKLEKATAERDLHSKNVLALQETSRELTEQLTTALLDVEEKRTEVGKLTEALNLTTAVNATLETNDKALKIMAENLAAQLRQIQSTREEQSESINNELQRMSDAYDRSRTELESQRDEYARQVEAQTVEITDLQRKYKDSMLATEAKTLDIANSASKLDELRRRVESMGHEVDHLKSERENALLQVALKQNELADLKSRYDKSLNQMELQKQSELEDLESRHQEYLRQMELKKQSQLKDLESRHEISSSPLPQDGDRIAELQSQHKDAMQGMEMKHQRELAMAKSEYDEALREASKSNADELKKMKREYDEALRGASKSNEDELKKMKRECEKKHQDHIADLNRKHDENLHAVKTIHQDKIDQLKREYEDASNELSKEKEQMTVNYKSNIDRHSEQIKSSREAEGKELEALLKRSNETIQRLKRESTAPNLIFSQPWFVLLPILLLLAWVIYDWVNLFQHRSGWLRANRLTLELIHLSRTPQVELGGMAERLGWFVFGEDGAAKLAYTLDSWMGWEAPTLG